MNLENMWQKPAKAVLAVHDAIQNVVAFVFFCVFSGALGLLLRGCIDKKAGLADKISFVCLAISMSVFYGLYIYGMIAAKSPRATRLKCGLTLLLCLTAFLVGFFIVGRI